MAFLKDEKISLDFQIRELWYKLEKYLFQNIISKQSKEDTRYKNEN